MVVGGERGRKRRIIADATSALWSADDELGHLLGAMTCLKYVISEFIHYLPQNEYIIFGSMI